MDTDKFTDTIPTGLEPLKTPHTAIDPAKLDLDEIANRVLAGACDVRATSWGELPRADAPGEMVADLRGTDAGVDADEQHPDRRAEAIAERR